MQMISSIEKLTNALIIIPFTFQVHSGSYIRSLFYGLSSVVVMFSLVCHVFAVAYLDASSNCGPFKGMERIRCVYKRIAVSLYRLCGMNLSRSDLVINSILLS